MTTYASIEIGELPTLPSGYDDAAKATYERFLATLPEPDALPGVVSRDFVRVNGPFNDDTVRDVGEGLKAFQEFRRRVGENSEPDPIRPLRGFYIPEERATRVVGDGGPAPGNIRVAAAVTFPYWATHNFRLPGADGILVRTGENYGIRVVEVADFAGSLATTQVRAVRRYGLFVDAASGPGAIAEEIRAKREGRTWPPVPLEWVVGEPEPR